MTVEERFEQIERLHAEHVQMARDDRAAHIAWKRDMESQVNATWMQIERTSKAIEQMAVENKAGFAEMRGEFKERDHQMRGEFKERDRLLDERIGKLVTAIGDLIRRMDAKAVQ